MGRAKSRVEAGGGDVFADLGFADAGERSLRVRLAWVINLRLAGLGLTQREAGALLGLAQPHVSELRHYKLRRFTSERLLELLTKLAQDVEIRVSASGKRARGRVTVSVA
jgi:predicted XRE-type DNA-binding protein